MVKNIFNGSIIIKVENEDKPGSKISRSKNSETGES